MRGKIRDNTSQTQGFSPGGNEPVGESECSEAAGIGHVSFGPGGGKAHLRGSESSEKRGNHRGHSPVPVSLQQSNDMLPQFFVELFPIPPCVAPEQGRVGVLFAVAFADGFADRKDPRDDGDVFRPFSLFEGFVEDLFRSEVKPPDHLLVLPEERILAGSKPHQGTGKILALSCFLAIGRMGPDEFSDRLADERPQGPVTGLFSFSDSWCLLLVLM